MLRFIKCLFLIVFRCNLFFFYSDNLELIEDVIKDVFEKVFICNKEV